ncbi:hypothetical protein SE15_03470 [Thermanaerothrix daxensis]|uniref:Uncharacterized protein n=1 Tax=Thermanaerothrix daxensis TaxID=869279 RepID=A0A0P6YN98_9CHLR|nr:hypothetical protein SE15_03470 [Thermanaerothrix daxensis]
MSGLLDQRQDNVMHRGQYPGRSPFRHSRGIFPKGHLLAIMQAGFNNQCLRLICIICLGEAFSQVRRVMPCSTAWLV